MRALVASGAAMLALLAIAPAASGHGILRQEGDVLRYTAPDPRVGATLTISSPEPGTLEFFDTTSPGGMDWGPCIPVNERKSRCSVKGVARVEVEVFDGDDTVTVRVPTPVDVRGGAGADNLTGGYGADALAGGSGDDALSGGLGADIVAGAEGNDSIDVRDGAADVYACGDGADAVSADPLDIADPLEIAACESADVAEPMPDASQPKIEVTVEGRLKPNNSGKLPIPVALDEPGTVALKGKLLIGGDRSGGLGGAEAAPDAPDQVHTLKLNPSKQESQAIDRALDHGKRVEVELELDASDTAGNASSARERVRMGAR